MSLPLPRDQIVVFLKVRNALRVIVIVGFYGCVALALAKWAWSDQAAVHMRSYIALMVILGLAAVIGGYLLRAGRCPVCGHVFSIRADGKSRNNFTSHCLTCGLSLDGSNVADYAARTTTDNREAS